MKPYRKSEKKTVWLSVLVFSFLFIAAVSCKKGNDGPAGPVGVIGPAGPTGTANVMYSDWFTPSVYKKDTVFGNYGFYYDDAVASLTQKILDSGTVITFGKLNGYNVIVWPANQVSALPINITYLNGSTPNMDTWSALVTPGNLRIRLVSSLNLYGSISNQHQFRYIIIPGGVKVNSTVGEREGRVETNAVGMAKRSSDYANMSYTELCASLKIPE